MTLVSLTSSSTAISNTNNPKKYNPHELTEAELKTIPENEKQILLQAPGESGSPWDAQKGTYGTYYVTMGIFLEKMTPNFLQMLRATEQSEDVSHLQFGGFNFKLDKGKVIKTQTNPRKKSSGGPFQYKPVIRYIKKFFFGTPSEVAEHMEQNKDIRWEPFGEPHYNDDRDTIKIGIIAKEE